MSVFGLKNLSRYICYTRFCLLQGHCAFLLQWMVGKFKTLEAGGWEGLCWLKQPSTKFAAFPLRNDPSSSSRARTCLACVAEVLRLALTGTHRGDGGRMRQKKIT